MKETNCRNCGAPLGVRGKCEYCGTLNRIDRIVVPASSARIEITPDRIGYFVDNIVSDCIGLTENLVKAGFERNG